MPAEHKQKQVFVTDIFSKIWSIQILDLQLQLNGTLTFNTMNTMITTNSRSKIPSVPVQHLMYSHNSKIHAFIHMYH